MENILQIIMTIFILAFAAVVYLIPTFIAFARENPHRYVVFWLNLFLGWSGIVWVGLLIWAIVVRVEGEGERSSPGPSAADAPRHRAKPVTDPITQRGHPYL